MWTSNPMLIIALPEQHYNNPNHTRQLWPHNGPKPMEAVPFRPRVGEATPPHPYKPLGLSTGPLPHRQETSCLYQELGPSVHFPLAVGPRSPQQLQTIITSLYDV